MEPLTDKKIKDVAEAADKLSGQVVDALAATTGGDPEVFDIDPDVYEFPEPESSK